MNMTRLSPDDPKLTAYALGELDATEASQVAAAIKDDAAAQAAVDEIRALAGQLTDALENEPISTTPIELPQLEESAPSKIVRFPLYWASGLAAACLFVVLISHQLSTSKAPATATDVAATPTPAAKPGSVESAAPAEHPSLPIADMRKRALAPVGGDVKPAPLRDDGLKLGRTVADASGTRSDSSTTASTGVNAASISSPSSHGSVALQTKGSLRPPHDYSPSLDYGIRRTVSDAPALVYNRASRTYEPAQGFLGVTGFPLSSLSANVPTTSYASLRDSLQNGRLPAPDAVRVEEMLNYFSYGYSGPRDGSALAASVEVAAAPWNPEHRLVRIGVKGRDVLPTSGSSVAVAKDVRLQVEFNPDQAKSYRLIGYENAAPKPQEVASSHVSGSEVDAGTAVTALYEVVPRSPGDSSTIEGDPLRYDSDAKHLATDDPRSRELLNLKILYTIPTVEVTRKIELPVIDKGAGFSVASKDFKFAAAVAGFGMLLKESPHKGSATYDKILSWAQEGQDTKEDPAGARHEFIDLVKKAKDATVE